jgi:hypothetical protein
LGHSSISCVSTVGRFYGTAENRPGAYYGSIRCLPEVVASNRKAPKSIGSSASCSNDWSDGARSKPSQTHRPLCVFTRVPRGGSSPAPNRVILLWRSSEKQAVAFGERNDGRAFVGDLLARRSRSPATKRGPAHSGRGLPLVSGTNHGTIRPKT